MQFRYFSLSMALILRAAISPLMATADTVSDKSQTLNDQTSNDRISEEMICVLNFERKDHPLSKKIYRSLGQNPNVHYKDEALPIDIVDCVANRQVSEITIIAHSLGGERLGYFQRLEGQARADRIAAQNDEIAAYESALLDKAKQYRCPSFDSKSYSSAMNYARDSGRAVRCELMQRDWKWLENLKKEIQKLTPATPIYNIAPILNRPFKLAADALSSQGKHLKKIRLLGCRPEESLDAYPDLNRLISENGIELEFAPKQNLMSRIVGHKVATLDRSWLAESAQFDDANDLDDSFYTYIKLKTRGVKRSGESTVLRGRYQIAVEGPAIGFGVKWTKISIPYSVVDSLEIGESTTVRVHAVDLSFSLWFNGEIQFGGVNGFHHIPMSETNSIGASIGFAPKAVIKRLY